MAHGRAHGVPLVTFRVIIRPAFDREGRRRFCSSRGPKTEAWFEGERIVKASAQSFLDACRILAARGATGTVEAWREGSAFPHLRGDVIALSGLAVREGDRSPTFVPYRAFPEMSDEQDELEEEAA